MAWRETMKGTAKRRPTGYERGPHGNRKLQPKGAGNWADSLPRQPAARGKHERIMLQRNRLMGERFSMFALKFNRQLAGCARA